VNETARAFPLPAASVNRTGASYIATCHFAERWHADARQPDNKSSKGRNGGRTVPLHRELRDALVTLKASRNVLQALGSSSLSVQSG